MKKNEFTTPLGLIRAVIIENDADHVETLQRWLEQLRFVEIVGIGTDEKSGYAEIAAKDPDVVFLDIEMEREDSGFIVLEKASKAGSRASFIITTGFGGDGTIKENAKKGYKLEVFDFLEKPFTPDDLEDTLFRWLMRNPKGGKVHFNTAYGEEFFDPMDIWYCQSEDTDKTMIYFDDTHSRLVGVSIGEVYERLKHVNCIVRAGRASIINLAYLSRIYRAENKIIFAPGVIHDNRKTADEEKEEKTKKTAAKFLIINETKDFMTKYLKKGFFSRKSKK